MLRNGREGTNRKATKVIGEILRINNNHNISNTINMIIKNIEEEVIKEGGEVITKDIEVATIKVVVVEVTITTSKRDR